MKAASGTLEYGPLRDRDEEGELSQILTQCFNFAPSRWDRYADVLGRPNLRRLVRGRRVVAGLGILHAGQWFGGRSIPLGGIAAVGVPPEERGSGVAYELMVRTLRELRERGVPLSSLYPATQHLYRKAGYEMAGCLCRHSLPAASIGRFERELRGVPVLSDEEPEALRPAYDERARRSSGNLDRSPAFWTRVLNPPEERAFVYRFGEDQIEGYVVFTQERREMGYNLQLRDLVAITPRASRSIWAFLSDHRSVGQDVCWFGPVSDPMLALLPEQTSKILMIERWFLRIVDAAGALSARGYPAGFDGALRFTIRDEALRENDGTYLLEVSGGEAKATAAGGPGPRRPARSAGRKGAALSSRAAPEIRLSMRGLAPLYSGYLTARHLAGIGWLEGDPAALETAGLLFSGPESWMAEGF